MKAPSKSALKKRLLSWVDKFDRVPILVVGDLMVDRTLRGSVDRISPEAPVPVLTVQSESMAPGGAGNVVCNLSALGAAPTLVAVRGADEQGAAIVKEFERRGLGIDGLIVDRDRPTITKTRVSAGQQQIVRVDFESRDGISGSIGRRLIDAVRFHADRCPAVIISDYGKGVVSPAVIKQILRTAHRRGHFVCVDPKIEHFMRYRGVDCITPNAKEAVEGMRILPPKDENGFLDLGRKIVKKLKCQSLLITRGERGINLFLKDGSSRVIPAEAREVFDVTGAGDTVIATFTLARAVGAPYEDAARIANIAAGIVVAKLGTAVASLDELKSRIRGWSPRS